MNREERRRAAKNGVDHKLLRQIQDESKKEGISKAVDSILASVVLTMRDKHGWGQKRCAALLQDTIERFDAVENGYITTEDLIQTVKDELQIEIRRG